MEKVDLLLQSLDQEMTCIILICSRMATSKCKGLGNLLVSWLDSLYAGTSLYSGSMIFEGSWPSLQHGAHGATNPLVCFSYFIWGHQHTSHAQWLLFSFVTGSYSLAPSKHTHYDTLPSVSWAHQPLPASGSSHILMYCRVLLFLLLPPFWFCWANSNSSFHFNFNVSSSERHSWPPPHTNSYLPIMVSHGALFFLFLTHMWLKLSLCGALLMLIFSC